MLGRFNSYWSLMLVMVPDGTFQKIILREGYLVYTSLYASADALIVQNIYIIFYICFIYNFCKMFYQEPLPTSISVI